MSRLLFAGIAALLTLAPIGFLPASAEPTVKESISYYDVSGATAAELRTNLNFVRPKQERDGRSYDAVTRWSVRWRYTYQNGAQGCAIASASTFVEVKITMPRFAAEASTSAVLTRAFAEYTEKLLVHEKGHGQNGVDTARRIEAAIRALPPQRSCDDLGRSANTLGDSLLKEGNRLDVEYDARTEHGRTQGARFP